MALARLASVAAASVGLAISAACGSSATTSTAPTPLSRCGLTLTTGQQSFPAEGGSGAISVSATRDCTWTVDVEGSWLSLKSAATGQGNGQVEFSAAPNIDPAVRRGALILNSQRAEITQAAAQCVITLGSTSASFSPSGGSGRVEVRASSQMCQWSASANQPWIVIRAGSEGRGTGEIAFDVAPAQGPPRVGIITVGEQRFSVTQSEGCTYSISPTFFNAPSQGGNGSVAIATAPACPWNASSSVSWLTFGQESGSGPATIPFTVLPTNGPTRSGAAVIAGQSFSITQSQGCVYQVQPASHNVPAGGGTATVNVTAGQGCSWNATSDAAWITIQGATSGSGNGLVTFSAAAATGPARSGTLTIAGQKVTVSQGQGCTFAISPMQESIPASGGTGKVTVTTADGCAWTASSAVAWITISTGGSGSGGGTVTYSVAATSGPARSGTLQVAGQTFTVNQGQGCAFTIVPPNATVPDVGGPASFEVQTSAGCAWTATSQVPWVTITANATGTGNAMVQLSVAANSGPSRSGTVTAGSQTFTVNQSAACVFTLTPTSENVPAGGGGGSVAVAGPAGCPWTASANAAWLSITGPASGNGPGNVAYSAAANAGGQRTGTLTIAGQTFTVNQASGCTFTVNPETVPSPAAGGPARIDVTAAAECSWTAASGTAWITVAPGSGNGPGAVDLSIAANTGPARVGTATIAGRTVTVNQESGCTYSINPTSATIPATGGSGSVNVTAGVGCQWRAESQVTWIVITAGSTGTGDGVVQGTVEANTTGAPRVGTVTIAGLTFTVNQQ